MRPPPPGLVNVQNTVQTFENKNISLPLLFDHSAPAPVTTISPYSSSDLDTHQAEAVEETLSKVAQMFNQTLLTTTGGTPNCNTGSNNDLHEKINMDRQPAPTLTQ